LTIPVTDRLNGGGRYRFCHIRAENPETWSERHCPVTYSSGSTTVLPRYAPQLGHARWGCMASPQSGHVVRFGAVCFLWVRRLSLLALDVFRLGTAI